MTYTACEDAINRILFQGVKPPYPDGGCRSSPPETLFRMRAIYQHCRARGDPSLDGDELLRAWAQKEFVRDRQCFEFELFMTKQAQENPAF